MLDSCIVSWVTGHRKTQRPSAAGGGTWGAAGERREDWMGHGWRGKEAHV